MTDYISCEDLRAFDQPVTAIIAERGAGRKAFEAKLKAYRYAKMLEARPTIIPADGYSKQDNHRAEIEMQIAKEEVHDDET